MNIIAEKEILGEYADQGFSLEECDGHLELYLKDTKIKDLPAQIGGFEVRNVIEQFLKCDQEIERLLRKAEAKCGLDDIDHEKLSSLIAKQEAKI